MWLPVISILWAIVYLLRRKPNEILIEASPFLNGKASSHLFNTRESEYFTTPYETESFLMGFTQRGTRKSEAFQPEEEIDSIGRTSMSTVNSEVHELESTCCLYLARDITRPR
ncbi:uncharacterized protein LOC124951033 isoform X7 [Vespa velutina]|uniref:uncharacterized protein LOC124951033 isoform X7 n=1 Tax=Vespa velutina TaxID=202808 RepID=UPI001FB28E34|nr:uncharacterized protein LOC124951033 isoform X7 [Vespa velutina]